MIPINQLGTLVGPQQFTGPTALLWCPTYRELQNTPAHGQILLSESSRTSTTVFMKMLVERIRVETSANGAGDSELQWRRLVFTIKGPVVPYTVLPVSHFTNVTIPLGDSAIQQYNRICNPLTLAEQGSLFQILFRGVGSGVGGSDWYDPLTAFKDSENVKFLFDRVINIRSGNANGVIKQVRYVHRFGKNLKYNDIEVGVTEGFQQAAASQPGFSTQGKPGMGDVYVLDLFRPIGASSVTFTFLPEAQMYWHER